MFKCSNETEHFSYEDCVLSRIVKTEDGYIFEVEALIVKANNSQNSNFTDSYAGTTEIRFDKALITDIIKVGLKYFDADGKLIKEIPDESMPKTEWGSLIKSFDGNYLPSLEPEGGKVTVEVEMTEEDGSQGNSYLIVMKAADIVISWEKYLNRVQK